jgi:hypothetical protein
MATKYFIFFCFFIFVSDIFGQAYIYRIDPDLLLDSFPSAAVAFSLRKLDKDYTGFCVTVRRVNGDTINIGFRNNYLDTISLKNFCGTGAGDSCWVRTWFDQSGNANNLRQTLSNTMPTIMINGVINYVNGRVGIKSTSAQHLFFNSALKTNIQNFSYYIITRKNATGNQAILVENSSSYHWLDYGLTQYIGNTNSITISSNYAINTQYLTNFININQNSLTLYRNNNQIGTRAAISEGAGTIFVPSRDFRTATIDIQEWVFYIGIERSNDRNSISGNINRFYSIY